MKSFVKANWKQMLIAFAVALALATVGIITLFCVQANLGKSDEFIAKSVVFDSNDEKNNGIIDVNDAPSQVASCFCMECNVDDGTGAKDYPVDKENMSNFAKCTKKALVIDNLESFLWLCEPNINLNGNIGGYLQTANKYEFCYVLKTDLNLVSVDAAGYQYRDREYDDALKAIRFTGIGNCTSGVLLSKWKSETLRQDCVTEHSTCTQFKGHFDGGGHTITYTVIENADNTKLNEDNLDTYKREKGLFAGLDKATVKNINLNLVYKDTQNNLTEDAWNIYLENDTYMRVGGSIAPYAKDSYVTGINVKFSLVTEAAPQYAFGFGGAIGYITNTVLEKTNVNFKTISAISSELIASQIGMKYAGGVVLGNNGDIIDCKFNFTETRGANDILVFERFGGIACFTTKDIYNCSANLPSVTVSTSSDGVETYSTTIGANTTVFPKLSSASSVGGIVGTIGSGAIIEGCSSCFNFTGGEGSAVGGIAGVYMEYPGLYLVKQDSNVKPVVIKDCVSNGEILNAKSQGGGIIAAIGSYVNDLTASVTIAGQQSGERGGLPRGVQILNCESKVKRIGVLKTNYSGGIVGSVSGLVQKALMDTVNGNTLEGCDDVKFNNYFIMRNCRSHSEVRGTSSVGGLVGMFDEYHGRDINNDSDKLDDTITSGRKPVYIEIKNCEVYGNIQGGNNVGGAVGYMRYESNNAFMMSRYAYPIDTTRIATRFSDVGAMLEIDGIDVYGDVQGRSGVVGGIVGFVEKGTFVSPTSQGGIDNLTLATDKYGHIRNCNMYGNVTGTGLSGGIAGLLDCVNNLTIDNCNVFGNVTNGIAAERVGGIVGSLEYSDNIKIHKTNAYGEVRAEKASKIGGIVGRIFFSIVEIGGANVDGTDNGMGCKVYGDVIGGSHYGGIVGTVEYVRSATIFSPFHRKAGLTPKTVKGVVIQWCDVYGDVSFVPINGAGYGIFAGGIAGRIRGYVDILNCNVYSNEVVGYTNVAGIVGAHHGVAIDSSVMLPDVQTAFATEGLLLDNAFSYRTNVKNVNMFAKKLIGKYNGNTGTNEAIRQSGLANVINDDYSLIRWGFSPAATYDNVNVKTALNYSWGGSPGVITHSVLFGMYNFKTLANGGRALDLFNITYQYTSPKVVDGTVNEPSSLGSYLDCAIAATNVSLANTALNASVAGYVTYKPIVAKPGATPGTGEEVFQGFWASKPSNLILKSQNMGVTIKSIAIYQSDGAIDYLVYDGKTRYRCKTILNNGSAITRDVGFDVSVCGSGGTWNTSIEFETPNLYASGAKVVVIDNLGKQYILSI